jgi:hypothetical protein
MGQKADVTQQRERPEQHAWGLRFVIASTPVSLRTPLQTGERRPGAIRAFRFMMGFVGINYVVCKGCGWRIVLEESPDPDVVGTAYKTNWRRTLSCGGCGHVANYEHGDVKQALA